MEPPQHGGKLLGSGVYGCTFEPAPRCAGGSVFKTVVGLPAVGKVTYEDAVEELGFGREIMALPLAKQYFAVAATECRPVEPIADPDARRCDAIDEAKARGKPLDMLIMPAAGEPIEEWAKNLPRLAANFKRIFVHLLEGATIYQRAGIVHNDIHDRNVLVDGLGVARFIDFGLSFRVSDARRWEDANITPTFRPRYVWQAPEVYSVKMMKSGVDVPTGVRQLKEAKAVYEQMERMFPARESLTRAVEDVQDFVRRHGEVAFLRRYAKQFDAWRIGVIFWFLWYDLLMWGGFRATDVYRNRDLYRRVIGGLTDFNPSRRLTVSAALQLLDPGNKIAEAH